MYYSVTINFREYNPLKTMVYLYKNQTKISKVTIGVLDPDVFVNQFCMDKTHVHYWDCIFDIGIFTGPMGHPLTWC